ncbi:MAG: InlB B-repeat-containing protein, partial [Candidatus Scatosoma sp.]
GERFGEKIVQSVKIKPTGDIAVTGASVYIGNETTENGVDKNGIRFQVLAKKTVVESGAEIGALLLPADMTTENQLKADTVVIQNDEAEGEETITNETLSADKWLASDYADYLQTNVYLYNFPVNDFNREILVSAYIKSEENYTYSATVSRSMAYVALAAEKDGDDRAADYIKSYNVNYYGEDGETEIDGLENVGVRYGSLITKPADPEISGKAFIGWYTDKAYNEVFDFENTTVKGTTNLYSKWENIVTVTGSYSYTSGTYANGVYTNTGDTVTVAAGKYTGSVDTVNQTYEIELPESIKEVTLSSKMFRDVKAAVSDTTAAEASFSVPKMTPVETFNVVTYSENGFSLTNKNSAVNNYLFTESAVATGGFVVKYTVTASTTNWLNQGGFAMKMGEKYYRMALTNKGAITIQSGVSGVSSWDSESKYTGATMPYATEGNKLTVTVAYYNETFYVQCDNSTNKKAISFTYSTTAFDWGTTETQAANKAMCNAGDKTLGLCAPSATVVFENVSYAIGDEVAKAEAQAMQLAIDSITVAANTTQMLENATAEKGTGWTITMTISGTSSTVDFERGGLYITSPQATDGYVTWFTIGNARKTDGMYLIVRQNNASNWETSKAIKIADTYDKTQAVTMTVTNYNDTLYFKVGEITVKVEGGDFSAWNKSVWSATTNIRSYAYKCSTCEQNLGLGGLKAGSTFTNVRYAIGNESAKAAAQEMGFTL